MSKFEDSIKETEDSKLKRLRELEERVKLREGLPFLLGWKWYPWARKFYESTNKLNFLCAANQISKSSTQIRKCIHWATDTSIWPSLWTNIPTQFWYLYPSINQATAEFKTKWVQFLPKGEFKDHPVYGWKAVYKSGEIHSIVFNSGVYIFFKTYTQDVDHLQSGTVDAMFCDEELPVELYEELMFRLSASDGYFHMVFTATIGQEFWRLTMEPEDHEQEKLPHAFKQTVSMYDCMMYEDGTPSHWTLDKIKQVEARCSTQDEVLKRVWGKFIVDKDGRKYQGFDLKKHMIEPVLIPSNWLIYAGADIGGGGTGHPAAIAFIAVRPDFKLGHVFLGWRGDGETTTAGDVLAKYQTLKLENHLKVTQAHYDQGCKDFGTIANRVGEPFLMSEKSHEVGEDILNTLFKHNMLFIHKTDQLVKLGAELAVLRKDTPKRKAKDDFCDSMRYPVVAVPWDFTGLSVEESVTQKTKLTPAQQEIQDRRERFEGKDEFKERIQDEINEWNDLY